MNQKTTPQYPDNHPLLRMTHIRNRCHRLAAIRSVTSQRPQKATRDVKPKAELIHLTHFVLDNGGNVEMPRAEPHQQYII